MGVNEQKEGVNPSIRTLKVLLKSRLFQSLLLYTYIRIRELGVGIWFKTETGGASRAAYLLMAGLQVASMRKFSTEFCHAQSC